MFVDKLNSIFSRKCCASQGVLHHVTDSVVTMRATRATEEESKQRKMYQQACRLLCKNHADKVLVINTSADDLPTLLKDDLVNGMIINSSGNASIESDTSYHAPSLDVVLSVCRSAQSWLSAGGEGQVVVLHCTLGHTALIAACLLLYLRVWNPEIPSEVHTKHGELLRVLAEGRDGNEFPYLQLRFLDDFVRYLTSFPSNSALLANAKSRTGQKRILRGIILRRAPKRLTPLHTLFDGSVSVNQTEVEWLMSSFGQLIEIAPHLQLPPGCVSGNGLSRSSSNNSGSRVFSSIRRARDSPTGRLDDRSQDRGRERWNGREDDRPSQRPLERNESLEDKNRTPILGRAGDAGSARGARDTEGVMDIESAASLSNATTDSNRVGQNLVNDSSSERRRRDLQIDTGSPTTPTANPQNRKPQNRAVNNGSGGRERKERCALGDRCPCVFTPVCMVMEGNELRSSSLISGVCNTTMNHGGTKDVVIGLDVAVQGNVTIRLYHAQTAPTPNRKLCEVSVDVGLIPQDVERSTITFPQHEMLFEKQMDFKPNFSITLVFGEVGNLEKQDDPAIQHITCRHNKSAVQDTEPTIPSAQKTNTDTNTNTHTLDGDSSDGSLEDDNWSGSHPNDVGRVDDRTIRQIRDMIEGRTMGVRAGLMDMSPFGAPSWGGMPLQSPTLTPRGTHVRSPRNAVTSPRARGQNSNGTSQSNTRDSSTRNSTSSNGQAPVGITSGVSASLPELAEMPERDMPELLADESDGDYAVRLQAYFDYEERRMRRLQIRNQTESQDQARSQPNISAPEEVRPISPTAESINATVDNDANTHDAESDARLAATMQASFANEYLPEDQNARWVIIAHSLPVVPYTVSSFKTEEELAEAATEDIECQVCKSEFEEGENLKILPCIHRYHEQCISKWLWLRGTCPICMYHLDNVLKEPSELL